MHKDDKRLVDAAVEQGWRVEPKRDGVQLKSPDGITLVTIHNTPSDWRARANTIAKMRRGGFQWPPKGKGEK